MIEEEARDGNLDKSNTVASSVPEENETQDVHSTTQKNVPKTPTRAPTTQNTITPTSTTTPTSTNSSESSNPQLRDIYDELQEAQNDDSCINFALLVHGDPISFEEAMKIDKCEFSPYTSCIGFKT